MTPSPSNTHVPCLIWSHRVSVSGCDHPLPPPFLTPPPWAPMCRCIIAVGWTDILYKFQDAFHWILVVYFAMVMAARHGG